MSNDLELVRKHPVTPLEQMKVPLRYSPATSRILPARNAASETDWHRTIIVLRKNWKLSALFFLAVLIATAVVTLVMKPVYEPEAKIELEPPGRETFSLQSGGDGSADADYLETQAQKLQSDELAVRVIRTLHLDRNPEFAGKFADHFQVSEVTANNSAPSLTEAENAALRSFRQKLTVRRDTSSRLVFLKFASHDPVLAASAVNTLISQYVESSYETRHEAIAESSQWLARELDDIRLKMEQANSALQDFQKTNAIADVGDNKSTLGEQMGELDRQLGQAQADHIQAESYLNQARQSGSDSLPQVRDNPVMQSLVQKLGEARTELAQASVIYGANHPNVKKLHNETKELQDQIAGQQKSIVSELRTNATAAAARETLLSRQIQDTTKELNKVAQYNNLKREAQADADLYNNLYAKIKEAAISAASKSSNVRVVDRARILDQPTRPRLLFNLAGAMAVGLIGGIFIAFGKEHLESHVHTVDDIRKITGVSSIAMIPEFVSPGVNKENRFAAFKPWQLRGSDGRNPAEQFLLSRPYSPEAEAMRALYTSIVLARPDAPPKVILIGSPFSGEGKTTVAINLATALAQRGRTLLVDADLRRPGVAIAFGIATKQGIGDVLSGSAKLESVLIQNQSSPNLFILLAGFSSTSPSELTSSADMRNMIAELRGQFDYIVIDSPPILAFSDARALSPLVDGVILVGRSGTTTRQALNRSIELLTEVHSAPVLDVVLNAASTFTFPNYNYGYGYAA